MDNICEKQLVVELNLVNEFFIGYYINDYECHKLNGPSVVIHTGCKEYYSNNDLNELFFIYSFGYKELWIGNKLIQRTRCNIWKNYKS